MWSRRGWELRDAGSSMDGPVAQGRAKRTQVGYAERCVCDEPIIKPDRRIVACGCTRSPVIGNLYSGIDTEWQAVMESDELYQDNRCCKHLKL